MLRSVLKLATQTLLCGVVLGAAASPANAQSIIKQPGNHPNYSFEAEPHGIIGWDPPGLARENGFGLGFRGTIPIVDNGFIAKINNSVGIGFGLDWIHYDDDDYGYWCDRRRDGWRWCGDPYYDDFDVDYFVIPIVMQWNFWLHRRWSVFGEIGGALAFVSADDWYEDDDLEFFPLIMFGGGRFHINETVSLTARIGYPYFSFGASFLL